MLGIWWGNYALINLIYYLAFPYGLKVTYISPSTPSHLIWSPAEKDSLIEWYHYLDKVMTSTILQSHNYDNKFCCSRKHPHPSHRKLFNLNPPLNPTPLGGHGHLLKMQKGHVHTQGVYSTQKLSPIENHKLDKIKFNTRPEQDHSI